MKNTMDMNKVKSFFQQNDKFAAHCGCELLEVAPGFAKAKMQIKPHHLNGYKMCHGAAIFTLADYVFAAAANSHGRIAVAIDVNIQFLKAVTEGTVTAQAKEINCGPKLSTYDIKVTDDASDTVASLQCMAYRKKDEVKF